LAQDICTKTRLRSYGGHGYGHIFENVVPLMRRRGFDDREIEALLVNNPARLLTFRKWD
jgi:phosphotriesterase-related protein